MSRRLKKFHQAKNIFERMDVSRGDLPDFLRSYWMYNWIILWLFLLALTVAGYFKNIIWFAWPIISLTMIIARYFDIYHYRGMTLKGYPAGVNTFYNYIFIAFVPTVVGEIISYLNF